MKRQRVCAPRIPTLKDVHHGTRWSLCLRVYHKFHVERIGHGRKRVNFVLLDAEGTKMAATLYDDQVDRLDPLLKEGIAYYVSMMSVEPISSTQRRMFADNPYECRFTSVTQVFEMRNMGERTIPFFPPFLPCDQIFPSTLDNDIYIDVIGMVLYVSSVTFVDGIYNRRIPVRSLLLMDDKFNFVNVRVKDKMESGHTRAWARSAEERTIVILTMLTIKHVEQCLRTTTFSRVHFGPDVDVARQMKKRINNELSSMDPL